jgi:hypothetical protein
MEIDKLGSKLERRLVEWVERLDVKLQLAPSFHQKTA